MCIRILFIHPSKKSLSKIPEKTSVSHVLIYGEAGVGKSLLLRLILKNGSPQLTGNPDDNISFTLAGNCQGISFTLVNFDKEDIIVVRNEDQIIHRSSSAKFIQFIEFGGNIHPFIFPNPSVIIFVLSLYGNHSHSPTMEYCGANAKQEQPFLSDIQHCLVKYCSQGPKPLIITVGTHRDEENKSETCTKNEQLLALLNHFKCPVLYCDERINNNVIFAVKCYRPEDADMGVAQFLRDTILAQTQLHVEVKNVPTSLLVVEICFLKNAQPGGVLTFDDCLEHCRPWQLEKAALKHCFKKSNVLFLNYERNGDTVFCNPQVILSKVTELVKYCHQLRNNPGFVPLRDKGRLSLQVLIKPQFQEYYTEDLFAPQDLLDLLSIHSAVYLVDTRNGEYLMPVLLPLFSTQDHNPQTGASLMINFTDGYIPSALFHSLVCHLLSSGWEICEDDAKPVCLYQNCIKLCYRVHARHVTLMDMFSYIEVHVDNVKEEDFKKWDYLAYREIRRAVHSGIKMIAPNVLFEDAFLCTATNCTKNGHHLAVVYCSNTWKCTILNSQMGYLKREDQLMWFDRQESSSAKTGG